jgi:hypothetical protein
MEIVEYKTFTKHLREGELSDVTIYYFTGEVEVTYMREGIEYGAKGPYGPYNDDLLHSILNEKKIEYKILETDYSDGTALSSSNIGMISGFAFMAIPVIMIIVILIQARTIKKLTERIPLPETRA